MLSGEEDIECNFNYSIKYIHCLKWVIDTLSLEFCNHRKWYVNVRFASWKKKPNRVFCCNGLHLNIIHCMPQVKCVCVNNVSQVNFARRMQFHSHKKKRLNELNANCQPQKMDSHTFFYPTQLRKNLHKSHTVCQLQCKSKNRLNTIVCLWFDGRKQSVLSHLFVPCMPVCCFSFFFAVYFSVAKTKKKLVLLTFGVCFCSWVLNHINIKHRFGKQPKIKWAERFQIHPTKWNIAKNALCCWATQQLIFAFFCKSHNTPR